MHGRRDPSPASSSTSPCSPLKTRMQALGLRHVLRAEGPLALYHGVAAMGFGAGPAHAVYELAQGLLRSEESPDNPAPHATSGVLPTVASDAALTPMDTVKQRLQLRSSPYKGLCDCVGRMMTEEGIRGFYASQRTTVMMNSRRSRRCTSPLRGPPRRARTRRTAGATAGALAAAMTTPLDVVKAQLQRQGVCVVATDFLQVL